LKNSTDEKASQKKQFELLKNQAEASKKRQKEHFDRLTNEMAKTMVELKSGIKKSSDEKAAQQENHKK